MLFVDMSFVVDMSVAALPVAVFFVVVAIQGNRVIAIQDTEFLLSMDIV